MVLLLNGCTRCQDILLDNMKLGDNIARNIALRENVFMMAVCIELRIPLFLVGKPGSSKSLAKSIVADSMHGRSSENQLLKTFKEVSFEQWVPFFSTFSPCFCFDVGRYTCSPTSAVSSQPQRV